MNQHINIHEQAAITAYKSTSDMEEPLKKIEDLNRAAWTLGISDIVTDDRDRAMLMTIGDMIHGLIQDLWELRDRAVEATFFSAHGRHPPARRKNEGDNSSPA